MKMLTAEQIAWIHEKTKTFGLLTMKVITQQQIKQEFEKKFKRKVSHWTIVYHSKKVLGRVSEGGKKNPLKIIKNIVNIFENASVILYIFPDNIVGFDSKEDVKKYLEDNRPQQPFRVFTKHNAEIHTTVKVII